MKAMASRINRIEEKVRPESSVQIFVKHVDKLPSLAERRRIERQNPHMKYIWVGDNPPSEPD